MLVASYRSLTAGQAVTFSFEQADQDGFVFRALEVWPADQAPVRAEADPHGSSAFLSSLTITFDGDAGRS